MTADEELVVVHIILMAMSSLHNVSFVNALSALVGGGGKRRWLGTSFLVGLVAVSRLQFEVDGL